MKNTYYWFVGINSVLIIAEKLIEALITDSRIKCFVRSALAIGGIVFSLTGMGVYFADELKK